jgi:3-polyprenyl-4-hydroxybenzoate decarboxylase
MLTLFVILILLGTVLIVISKNKTYEHDAKAIGYGFILSSVILILPIIIKDSIRTLKENAIIEYINNEVEVINHGDSTYTFLWIDCN